MGDKSRRKRAGMLAWLWRLPLIVLVLDLIFVFVVWRPDGAAHLERLLNQEIRYAQTLPVTYFNAGELARRWANDINNQAFIHLRPAKMANTGVDHDLLAPLQSVLHIVLLIVLILTVRSVVLALAAPLFAAAAVIGIADGLVAWYMRRVGGGRESSFLYYNLKRLVGLTLLGVIGLYLALPFAVDPRFILLPGAVVFGLMLRLTVGNFKKYL